MQLGGPGTAGQATLLLVFVLFTVSLTFLYPLTAAYADISTWSKSYGGPDEDEAFSIQQTLDGGYVVAGTSRVFGYQDFWVVKLDSFGNVEWEKAYGGSSEEYGSSIRQTPDGGYIVAGSTESFEAESRDVWVVKLDSSGNVEWEKSYGGPGQENGHSIVLAADGGYVVIAETYSFGAGSNDAWIFKLDSDGDVEWEKTYGGSSSDWVLSAQQTSDSGYIAAGLSNSEGGWILKLESDGDIEWEKKYGDRAASSIQQGPDSGYIAAGHFFSEGERLWIVKIESDGNIEWQKTYGFGSEPDVRYTSDGGYIVAANTRSFNSGDSDLWILKLDYVGAIEWQKAYGGPTQEQISAGDAIQQTSDGGYVVGASAVLNDEQYIDFWILKLDADGNVANCDPGIRDTNALVADGDASLDDTTAAVEQTEATVAATAASTGDTNANIGEACDLSFNRLDLFENLDEPSDGLVEPGSSVRAVAVPSDSSISEVTFRWYAPGANLVRELTTPIPLPEDVYTPVEEGIWTIEADFGDGHVISKTINVSFFVIPESPIGAVALVISSLVVLGGFMLLRRRSYSTT